MLLDTFSTSLKMRFEPVDWQILDIVPRDVENVAHVAGGGQQFDYLEA